MKRKNRYRDFYNKINRLKEFSNPLDYYMSFFFKRYPYSEELVVNTMQAARLCKLSNFPFEKLNSDIFVLIENFSRRDYLIIQNVFLTLYTSKSYETIRDLFEAFYYDYFISKGNKVLIDGDINLYNLIKTYDDCSEMISSYGNGVEDKRNLKDFMSMLCAIYWIDKKNDYNEIYLIIKYFLSNHIRINEICLMKGIDINNLRYQEVMFLVDLATQKPKLIEKVIK